MLGTGAVIASIGSAAGCRRMGGSVDRRLSSVEAGKGSVAAGASFGG